MSSTDNETYADYLDVLEERYVDLHGASHPYASARPAESGSVRVLNELIPAAVIAAHSEYRDWEELAEASSYTECLLNDKKSVSSMPRSRVDSVVAEETDFESSKELIKTAINHLVDEGGD